MFVSLTNLRTFAENIQDGCQISHCQQMSCAPLVHFISFCFLDPLPPSTLKGIDAYSEIIQAHHETKRYSVRLLGYSRPRFRAEITFCFLCYLLLTCFHQIPERICNLKMAEVSPVFNCAFSGPIDHGSVCNIW